MFEKTVIRLLAEAKLDWALKGEVPAEPGKSRIPGNHIRLYHYTNAGVSAHAKNKAAESLRKKGILIGKARGSKYGEPNQVWSSTMLPHQGKVFAEFSVPKDDPRILFNGVDVTFGYDIKPKEIIAVHEPWHWRYRYILKNKRVLQAVVDGEHDDLYDQVDYGPAVYRAKHEYGVKESILDKKYFDGKMGAYDPKKRVSQRHGQRLRSKKRSRPVRESERPFRAKSRDELKKQPPDKLWHVTLSANKILAQGFKTADQLGCELLGGCSTNSTSFTYSKRFAQFYANGLRLIIESLGGEFDPSDTHAWKKLALKYGFDSKKFSEAVFIKITDNHHARRYTREKAIFEILQFVGMISREFPLFMGSRFPESILRARMSDVAILQITTDGPEWWSYNDGEKEFRIFDVWNIQNIRRVS